MKKSTLRKILIFTAILCFFLLLGSVGLYENSNIGTGPFLIRAFLALTIGTIAIFTYERI